MFRRMFFAIAATAALPVLGANAESFTTRIETRPFYGATVTLEEGVRVIRPLPPERHVIINPDGLTPLSLGFNETKVYERRDVHNYNSGSAPAARASYGYGGWYAGNGGFNRHREHDRRPGGLMVGPSGHHHGKHH